jgi:NADH-quinone oxidoreductase subunit L
MAFSSEWVWPAWLCWIIPLIGAVLTPLMARVNRRLRDYFAVAVSALTAFMTILLLPYLLRGELIHNQVDWIQVPGSVLNAVKAGVIVDPLSVIMANVVSIVSMLIMVYSLAYMEREEGLTRYWFFMNLFIGNMLLLVMSDNFIQLLFGWEGVGLCSYALIGFWYRDSKEDWLKCWVGEGREAYPPSHCGLKAFITTRIGDVGMLLGIFILLAYAGTLSFTELQGGAILKVPLWLLAPAAILMLGGPIGKSAQLPLMEWLPDAMAGPTTVSALIHAATMVKAGVYLVGRLFPMLYTAAWTAGSTNQLITFFYAVAWIGVVTAFVSGTQAMASTEIKKVLAYSTVSQLGYMMLALGVAGSTAEFLLGYTGGVFHLMSHAMFKAALFLTAGAVIHASHSRFLYHMGGLKRYMPITFWCTVLTAFSLMGVPLLFSGFWSKDLILEAALTSGQLWMFILACLTVAVTAFYSVRMIGLAFHGPETPRLKALKEEGAPIHDPSTAMKIPYLALTAGTVLFGVTGFMIRDWLKTVFAQFLGELLGHGEPHTAHDSLAAWIVTGVSVAMLIAGAAPAYLLYVKRRPTADQLLVGKPVLASLRAFLFNRWYINRFYYRVLLEPFIASAGWLFRGVESKAIDGVNSFLSGYTQKLVGWFRRTHTGILNLNVVGMTLGFILMMLMLIRLALGG